MPQLRRVDDLDDLHYEVGKEVAATQTREYTLGGKKYRNLFTDEHAIEFDDVLERYRSVAEVVTDKPVPGGTGTSRRSSPGGGGGLKAREKAQNRNIREWCNEQGLKVSDRGRIPDDALRAYFSAHPDETPVRSK